MCGFPNRISRLQDEDHTINGAEILPQAWFSHLKLSGGGIDIVQTATRLSVYTPAWKAFASQAGAEGSAKADATHRG